MGKENLGYLIGAEGVGRSKDLGPGSVDFVLAVKSTDCLTLCCTVVITWGKIPASVYIRIWEYWGLRWGFAGGWRRKPGKGDVPSYTISLRGLLEVCPAWLAMGLLGGERAKRKSNWNAYRPWDTTEANTPEPGSSTGKRAHFPPTKKKMTKPLTRL